MLSSSELSDNVNQSDHSVHSDTPPQAGAEQGDKVSDDPSTRWNLPTPLKTKPVTTYAKISSKRRNRIFGQNGKSPVTRKDPSEEDSQPEHESSEEEVASKRTRTDASTRDKISAKSAPKQVSESRTTPSKTSTRISKRTTSSRNRATGLSEQEPSQMARHSESNDVEKAAVDRRRTSVENGATKTHGEIIALISKLPLAVV